MSNHGNEQCKSMIEIFIRQSAEKEDKLFLADEEKAYTYGQALLEVKSYVYKLEELGLKAKDRLVVECSQDAKFVLVNLACEYMGVVFVPVEQKAKKERVEEICKETQALYCILSQKMELDATTVQITFEEFYDSARKMADLAFQAPLSEEVAEILYSTGTTGKAKGIVITHGNNVAVAENIKYGTQMKEDNVELIPMPLSHSHAIRTCYANLLNGSSVVIVDGVMKVKQVFELIEKYQVTSLDLSPSAGNVLVKLAKKKLAAYAEKIDFIEIGSAVLEEDLKEALCKIFTNCRLYNFYGSTEAGRSCILDFNKVRGKKGCIGKPTKNARFIITDQDRNEIKSSKENTGLLAIAGSMNMKEYLNARELTKATMVNGYIYTTDIAYIDEEGYVYVLGRADDVINYNGIKIAPDDIECQVVKFPGIKDCGCVPVYDPVSGQVPKVYYSAQGDIDEAKLLSFLAEVLEANKMPKLLEKIDEIPRTDNGKLLRRKLRER